MDTPTEFTMKDIEKIEEIIEERCKKSSEVIECCTCDVKMPRQFFHDGIQCDQCWFERKPIFSSSPVRDAYFQ